jgi:hypothetical protein
MQQFSLLRRAAVTSADMGAVSIASRRLVRQAAGCHDEAALTGLAQPDSVTAGPDFTTPSQAANVTRMG